MALTCSDVKENEEGEENGMITGRADRWNWEFGEKMEGGERNGNSYRSNCQVSCPLNREYDRISHIQHSYVPR